MESKRLFACCGVLLLIVSLPASQVRSGIAENSQLDVSILKDKSTWMRVNAKPYYIPSRLDGLCAAPTPGMYAAARKRNPHEGTYINVYVNPAGLGAMFSPTHPFPEGSVIIKEKIDGQSQDRSPILYTVMRKRQHGYNPEAGDWEFSVISGDGKKVEASGKLANCMTCHVTKSHSDFVFRRYLKDDGSGALPSVSSTPTK